MNIICSKCRSEKVFIEEPEIKKEPEAITMDDLQRNATQGIPLALVYHLTTYRCANCGYSVSF